MSEANKYAPVLEKMVEILGAKNNEKLTFGIALERASIQLDIPVPDHMYGPLLASAFRIIGIGRIPGAPDA